MFKMSPRVARWWCQEFAPDVAANDNMSAQQEVDAARMWREWAREHRDWPQANQAFAQAAQMVQRNRPEEV